LSYLLLLHLKQCYSVSQQLDIIFSLLPRDAGPHEFLGGPSLLVILDVRVASLQVATLLLIVLLLLGIMLLLQVVVGGNVCIVVLVGDVRGGVVHLVVTSV
jgi:hypothetical protein